MIKRIIIRNGKRYVVNTPGWNDGVGPGAPFGTLWEQSTTDNNWYSVNLTGTSGSLSIYVSSSTWQSPGQDFGYQLVQANDGDVYQVYISGSGASANLYVSQTSWPIQSNYKPYLILQSITDGNYYVVSLSTTTSGSVDYTADTTFITADNSNITADNSFNGVYFYINPTPLPPGLPNI